MLELALALLEISLQGGVRDLESGVRVLNLLELVRQLIDLFT